MTLRTLIVRSLRHHWRTHLGVGLGAAMGSAALIGALVVGDSVKGTLRERALARLGQGSFLIYSGDRLFAEHLPPRVRCQANAQALGAVAKFHQGNWQTRAISLNPDKPERRMLLFRGAVARADGGARVNRVQIIGISDFAPLLFPAPKIPSRAHPPRPIALTNEALVNLPLAQALGLRAGETIIIRFPKWNRLSPDAAISPRDAPAVSLRITVKGLTTNAELSAFTPDRSPDEPLSVFIPLTELVQAADLPLMEGSYPINTWLVPEVVQLDLSHLKQRDKFNVTVRRCLMWVRRQLRLPVERDGATLLPVPPSEQLSHLTNLLAASWDFENVQIAELRTSQDGVHLTSPRIFLEPPVARAAMAADPRGRPLLTYLANLLQAGTNTTPYSMVTAAGPPWTPADLRDDEIVINQWLADDLQVKPGERIALSYFDPESGARLLERTNMFRVRRIVPMALPWADRTLMPDFPGIEKAESTRDWDAGFPLTYKIRPKDEDYWKQFRGTPKAFITLAAGQKMWGNRFGNLTAIRFPMPANAAEMRLLASGNSPENPDAAAPPPSDLALFRAALEKRILDHLKPEELGLRFEPVREQALQAAGEAQDFGGLFLGFSFFVIAAALLLMAMLFYLGLEQRAAEIGILLALGFPPRQVRRLLLGEAVVLSLLGGMLGALGGLGYARALLQGLATVWRDAVGTATLGFHVTSPTLGIGLFASVLVSTVTIGLALRKYVQRPARELLVGEVGDAPPDTRSWWSRLIGAGTLVAALGLAGFAVMRGDTANAGVFFGVGTLVLIASLSFVSAGLRHLRGAPNAGPALEAPLRISALAWRGCARRPKRSLATVAMLACGSFLIVSIGVFRLDANRDALKRTSGTGGFALIGETTMPVTQDLNASAGRDFFALQETDLAGVRVVPFRVHEGDEASCLNLNRAQQPRLLGVKPGTLAGRFGFAQGSGWSSLQADLPTSSAESEEIPAIGDANSIQWAMKKKVGDTIEYVDERGRPFKVRIVGAVANSILQGQLIIDEAAFLKRFPGTSGYRLFLIDAPTNRVGEVSATLSRALQDVGLELTPAAQRLAQFNAVQNTYLGTFQVLGGLGLLLGSVGLGIVVLRNVLERRGELAVLLAVGFRRGTLQRLLLIENGALLLLGLGLGVVAAAVAVAPALLAPTIELPWRTLGLTLSAVLLNGILWTWAATRVALRGEILAALRNE